MLVSQAHSFAQQTRLAITLAWIAGYTNILTVLTCGTVTSHVSGTVSQWGSDLVQGKWSALGFVSFLLLMFLAGAMVSSLCTEIGRRRGWESIYILPMAVQAALLAGFTIQVELHEHGVIEVGTRLYAMTGLASMAMGLQNATITKISGGVVRTTHMTGVFTDIGLETVQFLFWLRDRRRTGPRVPPRAMMRSLTMQPSAKRLGLLASVVGSFALGAGLGTLGYAEIPRLAMIPPTMFLLWIIYQDYRTPICEIESSELVAGEAELNLPASIAVYHLRRDRHRKGSTHRLPDLLRWCERLPREKTIVILDLGEVTVLDSNAALELRALMKQSAGNGRRLVISGISGEQYAAMRAAGAGDVLDPTNVCPDLELAIARGVMLAEEASMRI